MNPLHSLETVIHVWTFTKLWTFVVLAELCKLLVQVAKRYRRQHPHKRNLKACFEALLLKFPFNLALISIVILVVKDLLDPPKVTFGIHEVLAIVILGLAYVMASMCGLLNTPWEKKRYLRESGCDLGYGMAKGFFAYLENGLTSIEKEMIFQDNQDNEMDGDNCIIGDYRPFIIFPNLTSDYYKGVNVNEISLLGGLIDYENAEKRKSNCDPVISLHLKGEYKYKTAREDKERNSHYLFPNISLTKPQMRSQNLDVYYGACDNRPIYALKCWQKENQIGSEEFQRQLESYEEHLLEMLENSDCKGKYIYLKVEGPISDALIKWTRENKNFVV